MNISKKGIDLIKKYEGCHLVAYRCPAGIWTIGYGHTKNVRQGMKITQAQADEYLMQDCQASVNAVNKLGRNFNQNQFDALVSFTFNCGAGNLKTLCHNRKAEVIAEKILLYNKGGGVVLNGLVKRRKDERALFLTPIETEGQMSITESQNATSTYPTLKVGSKGEYVKKLQKFLQDKNIYHGAIDGIFGAITKQAVIEWQGYCEIVKDGIVGPCTWATIG
jgi:lysozyme